MRKPTVEKTTTAGGAIFERLKSVGVDYVFCNSGTDFPPIIEGIAETLAKGEKLPEAMIIPHENVALGMAHGYYLATGKSQAVILHTNVGLANGAMAMINAATDHIPLILMSGRTPTMEKGRFGARTVPIGWGQEMRDQTSIVREASKWDYELRFPEQVPEIIDRAYAIANSSPRGPVYLSLPREVLCDPISTGSLRLPIIMTASNMAAPENELIELSNLLSQAERPLIIAQRGTGTSAGFDALARLADNWAIPVCQYWAGALALSFDHPSCVGSDITPWLSGADVILVLDGLAPWSPGIHEPDEASKIINLGPDPLHHRFPVRNFRSDLSIAGELGDALVRLDFLMQKLHNVNKVAISKRRNVLSERVKELRQKELSAANSGRGLPMSKAWVAKCVGEAVQPYNNTVLCELGCPLDHLKPTKYGSWHDLPHSGGLGWSLPTAIGMKLAQPERLLISTMGDGSYMFANPVACHQICESYNIPILSVILNNLEWNAVRRATVGLYPQGFAAKANKMPLTRLSPSPDFAKIIEASRGYGETITAPEELPNALARGIDLVLNQNKQVLLNVKVA